MIKIGLIHTTANSMQPINEAFRELAPEVKVLNFLDEGLMEEINHHTGITPTMVRRLLALLDNAEKAKVDGILLTCSVFSPYVEDIRKFMAAPVLSADMAMLEKAVQMGTKIGVIATVETAGPTSEGLLKAIAKRQQKNITVHTHVLTEAFTALKNGDANLHNKMIQQKALDLAAESDIVLLAQMSMTRAVKDFGPLRVPLLTSPEISVKAILAEIKQ
ncbi:aspartate/glutamate racemase family protein [Acetonema longum]|uniref:Asp/Glu/hydantoin racemase n=1 Tax=Acetonema longum DSM 6540 TaxID=1009370 RepID=F7NGL0_9FIRM|nr:aspartate/glutamate racemase family protein [Acetonema longum]EGO64814.1 Asp/Glu/hydantoin racemase [Acetonema longum DSM 6540]